MPLYDFKCEGGHRFERMVPLSHFEAQQYCDCNAPASRVISAPMFHVDQTGYTCPVTDQWIGSKHEHENNLRRQDCRVLEPGEKEAAASFRADADASVDRALDETVERQWDAMPSAKRERLTNELLAGSDLEVARETPNVN